MTSATPVPAKDPPDYFEAYAAFRREDALDLLSGARTGRLNAAYECCDRHCGEGRTALTWISQAGGRAELTFEELRDRSARFANLLKSLGVGAGDRVAGLLPRTPELLTVILGTWRAGAVYQPLFTAFGPKAIEHRLATSGAKLVVTDPANRPKLDEVANAPQIATVAAPRPGDLDFAQALAAQPAAFEPVLRSLDDPFLIMFTSGTTGPAKPLLVPLKALAAYASYMVLAIGLRPEDRFWNMADPGWAYGLYYAVAGPLAIGHATLFYDGAFSVEQTVEVIAREGITNLAGAPTGYRLMMAAGPEAMAPIKGRLRCVSSAGEPLNPEVIRWGASVLEAPIYDHYGQTEIGMVLANHHGLKHPVHPGSAGFPVPGYRVVVLGEDGAELGPGQPGALCVDHTASPLFWFGGYEAVSSAALGETYYVTGDVAELNGDGTISFVGRSDDVITSAGYRIGPFDVESVLIEHAAVVEAAVIGKPDPERTEIVKAFVVLHPTHAPGETLVAELQAHVRQRLSAHAYPREIEFVDGLPKTPSGKVQRFLLRNQEIAKAGPQS